MLVRVPADAASPVPPIDAGSSCAGSPRAYRALASGLALAVRPAGSVETPLVNGPRRRCALESRRRGSLGAGRWRGGTPDGTAS